MSLVLHCGADAITRDQLAATPLPMSMGPSHYIRPFIEDVELVTDHLRDHGLTVVEEAFGVKTRNVHGTAVPTQFFGLMQMATDARDFAVMVGLRGSYDQTLPRGLAVGSRVLVCDNLAFSGEVSMHTRQTSNIDERMPALVKWACSMVPGLTRQQAERFRRYRERELTREEGDSVLVSLFRCGVLNTRTLPAAVTEWDTPSHQTFSDEQNLWGLQNAVTEVLKGDGKASNVLPVWDRTIRMTQVLDRLVGSPTFEWERQS